MKFKFQRNLRNIGDKLNNKPPSNILQKVSNYATVLGSSISLLLGIISIWLMVKYSENKDMIDKLVTISTKLEQQNQIAQEQISQLSTQTKIALEQVILIKTQLSISEQQLKNTIFKDSVDKWASVIKFSDNYDQLLIFACLISDTIATRNWDNNKKYDLLNNLNNNLNEGLLNPILIEDKVSFDEWNHIALQVGGSLSTWPIQSNSFRFEIKGMTKEKLEKFNDDVFIDIIKNCSSASKKLFKRIICKYKYNASC